MVNGEATLLTDHLRNPIAQASFELCISSLAHRRVREGDITTQVQMGKLRPREAIGLGYVHSVVNDS